MEGILHSLRAQAPISCYLGTPGLCDWLTSPQSTWAPQAVPMQLPCCHASPHLDLGRGIHHAAREFPLPSQAAEPICPRAHLNHSQSYLTGCDGQGVGGATASTLL